MKIVVIISLVEMSVLMAWLIYKHYRPQPVPAVAANRSIVTKRRPNRTSSIRELAHYPPMNERLSEGQRDDRQQMNGGVAADVESGTSSGRAFARRSHQLMFKRWSQERRDEE